MSTKLSVAVIFGGKSNEHEISVRSATTIMNNLNKDKYTLLPVYITESGKWLLCETPGEIKPGIDWESSGTEVTVSFNPEQKGLYRIVNGTYEYIKVDILFPMIHGKTGEDGIVQGVCELAGLPYVGASTLSSAMCFDKAYTKIIAGSLGIKQADSIVFDSIDINKDVDVAAKKVRDKFPDSCIIKPSASGSSVGTAYVDNYDDLIVALREATIHSSRVIAERCIRGRELECGVINAPHPIASGVGEKLFSGVVVCDYETKYNNGNLTSVLDADLPGHIKEEIQQKSIAIFNAMDCEGMARVDFFWEENGDVIFNEINTIPGCTSLSMFPNLWLVHKNITNEQLVDYLIENAIAKHKS